MANTDFNWVDWAENNPGIYDNLSGAQKFNIMQNKPANYNLGSSASSSYLNSNLSSPSTGLTPNYLNPQNSYASLSLKNDLNNIDLQNNVTSKPSVFNNTSSSANSLSGTDPMSGFQKWQVGLGGANLAYSMFVSDPKNRRLKERELGIQQGLLNNKQDQLKLTKENLARQYAATDTLSRAFGGGSSTGTKYADKYFN